MGRLAYLKRGLIVNHFLWGRYFQVSEKLSRKGAKAQRFLQSKLSAFAPLRETLFSER
jgi:hypothetical protein